MLKKILADDIDQMIAEFESHRDGELEFADHASKNGRWHESADAHKRARVWLKAITIAEGYRHETRAAN